MSDLTTKDALLERAVAALEKIKTGLSVVSPTGTVLAFAGTTTPDGWLLCDGSAVSRTDYADLYAVIGDTYGAGDGSTTFNLPDLANKFIEGSATSGTVKSAGLPNITGDIVTRTPVYDQSSAADTDLGNGAISAKVSSGTWLADNSGTRKFVIINVDASKSNVIYGNSDTVQPPALTMQYIIKC